ncbi:nicotinamide-nucleotide adenylyltransferase, NadR type [bacterium A37T11]|nr:nicotinamide-nucleotide adenylyltransferase, NadR type [bacterium A37T11]
MENEQLIKIAVVGPESTGKSTLSLQLARHFDTLWVPEYAREYCSGLQVKPTLQDELNMYYGQLALERSLEPLAKHGILICDTTFITIKIWSDHFFGFTPPQVIEQLYKHPYDLYLLMDIDLPWEDDPLRDFPDKREHFMAVWQKELSQLQGTYRVISGQGEERFRHATAAVEAYLTSK